MINSIVLEGNLVEDAETRTVGETTVTNFRIANTRYLGPDKTRTLYRSCKGWGKRYSAVSQYLRKGTRVTVSGVEEEETWESDGQKHYKTVINVTDLSLAPSGARREDALQENRGASNPPSQGPDDFSDDLPF